MKILENYFRKILEEHDIRVDGSRPWDVSIINPKLFNRVFPQSDISGEKQSHLPV